MERTDRTNRYYQNQLATKLRELMEILAPGESLKWGAKKHDELVGYAAIHLAEEFHAITGMPVLELLTTEKPENILPTASTGDVLPLI